MYLDKLDGRISQDFVDRQAQTLRQEQEWLSRKTEDVEKASPAPSIRQSTCSI